MDAATKIYGYRVDCIHSDTLKLAGGVGKTAQEAGVGGAGTGGDGDQVGFNLCLWIKVQQESEIQTFPDFGHVIVVRITNSPDLDTFD